MENLSTITEDEAGEIKNSLQKSIQIYSVYRLLQIAALITYFLSGRSSYLGQENPVFFMICAGVYALICFNSLLQNRFKVDASLSPKKILFIFFSDVIALVSLIHFSGGTYGSLGILLVVAVATSAMFLHGRWVLFIPALASLLLLSEQIYLYSIFKNNDDDFALTGVLGLALFAAAIIIEQVAKRLRDSEATVSQQAKQVASLQTINAQVIERMPSGVIVVDNKNAITFMNTSSWRLLSKPENLEGLLLKDLSENIYNQLEEWKSNPKKEREPFIEPNGEVKIYVHFSELSLSSNDALASKSEGAGYIIFIENSSFISAQAQKMKLASLGTLTAGIAHEIRNPLGAISHAAQLLGESEALDEADLRLSTIIQEHSVRMNRIIENVLQLSRQKTGFAEDLDIYLWLKNFAKQLKASQPHPIQFVFNLDANIKTIRQIDSSQLSQVLTNLCENGLRYSYAANNGYYICVACGFDTSNRRHFIDVIDRGKGIEPEQAEKIFEPFFTTDSKGSGLGLYIAKELCENNHSQLSYRRTKDGGSCFRITFSS